MRQTSEERFEALYMPEPNSGCWIWIGAITRLGYSKFGLKGKWGFGHRVSYRLYKGEIPNGLEIDHLCRVRCCVNPNHLEAVTRKVNVNRGKMLETNAVAKNRAKTHCPHGHEYTEANTYRHRGQRHCWTCMRIRKSSPAYLAVRRARRRSRRKEG